MSSRSVSHAIGASNVRSHVFVLFIDDDDSEDVRKILDSLRRHRGWRSIGFGFLSIASASLAGECCNLTLRRFDLTVRRSDSIYPSQYPTVERNLTLLVPDLSDAPSAFTCGSQYHG